MTMAEVCVAMVVLSTAGLGAAQLFGVALNMAVGARLQTTATMLATQKVEQLRSLAWRFDGVTPLQPVSDTATDLTQEPIVAGGQGLQPSPASSLTINTDGYVDFLDRHGRWTSTGPSPPPSAVFIRRWNISPLPSSPADSLVLRVLVTTVVRDSQALPAIPRRRLAGDAIAVTVLTRKVR